MEEQSTSMAEQFIYHMRDLKKVYTGGKEVLKGIHLSFILVRKLASSAETEQVSLPCRIMAGQDSEFTGEAWLAKGYTAGYVPQEPVLDESLNVFENVKLGVAKTQALLDEFNEITGKMGEPMDDDEMSRLYDRMGVLQDKIDAVNAWELDSQVEVAMDALRLPPAESAVTHLSGGEKRRVALCRLLLEASDLLLLDEPTNHLDAESVAWLEGHLTSYHGTIVLITHDRYFLDNVTGEWILELDRGRGIPWKGNYSSWLDQKQKRMEGEDRRNPPVNVPLKMNWIGFGNHRRVAKRRARLEFAPLKPFSVNKTKNGDAVWSSRIPPGPRLGDTVFEAKALRKGFDEKLLIENLDFLMPPGAIVGIIGPNGAGKSTLFKMLVEQEQPDSGQINRGKTVEIAYVDQSRSSLEGDKTIWEEKSQVVLKSLRWADLK